MLGIVDGDEQHWRTRLDQISKVFGVFDPDLGWEGDEGGTVVDCLDVQRVLWRNGKEVATQEFQASVLVDGKGRRLCFLHGYVVLFEERTNSDGTEFEPQNRMSLLPQPVHVVAFPTQGDKYTRIPFEIQSMPVVLEVRVDFFLMKADSIVLPPFMPGYFVH